MQLLELHLVEIEDERKFKILSQGDSQPDNSVETEAEQPFWSADGTNWRRTALRCVETNQPFRPQLFPNPGEQDWLCQAGLLAPNRQFSGDLRQRIGTALYCSLFPAGQPSANALLRALEQARRTNDTLHIRFKFSPQASARSRLADYPWELLYKADIDDFLFKQRDIVCSRWLAYEDPQVSPALVDRLRVWLISPRPQLPDQAAPLSKQEAQRIQAALESSTREGQTQNVELETPSIVQLDDLSDRLLDCPSALRPQVIHFDGHGLYGQRCPRCHTLHDSTRKTHCDASYGQQTCGQPLPEPEGWLLFEDARQQPDYVSAKDFAQALPPEIKLVVLSACQSAMATVSASQFNGAAQRLIAQRIPAVVAMQYAIEENAASRFCVRLYRGLSCHQSVAQAVATARRQMDRDGSHWYRPLLYLRSRCNQGGQLLRSEADQYPLPQSFERLYQIFQPHQRQLWSALGEAFRSTLPPQFDTELPTQTLRQKLVILATELPEQISTEWSPAARFAAALFKDLRWSHTLSQELRDTLQNALQNWAEQEAPGLATSWREKTAQSSPTQNTLLQVTLRLSLRPALQNRGKYHLVAALVRDENPRGLEDEEPPSIHLLEAAAISYPDISAWLDQLTELLGDQDIAFQDLAVECCLPLELLHLALDIDWNIKVGRRRQLPLSQRCRSFVIRALDRHLPVSHPANAYAASRGDWKKNWKHADHHADDAWPGYFAHSTLVMPEMLDELMQKNCFTAWQFILPPEPNDWEDLFDGLLSEGVPIAVWLRSAEPMDDDEPVTELPEVSAQIEALLRNSTSVSEQDPPQGTLFGLPQVITAARKQPNLVTAGSQRLALMWDNPFRPVPKILYQQPSDV